MSRMEADIENRDRKDKYRARLFGLITPPVRVVSPACLMSSHAFMSLVAVVPLLLIRTDEIFESEWPFCTCRLDDEDPALLPQGQKVIDALLPACVCSLFICCS